MNEPVGILEHGLVRAQERLRDAARLVADAAVGHADRSSDAAMATTARAALFDEALLAAMHARFAELKAVAKP